MKIFLISLITSVFFVSGSLAQANLIEDEKVRHFIFQDISKQGIDKDPKIIAAAQAAYDAILIRAWGQRIISNFPVTVDMKKTIYRELKTTVGDTEYQIIHIFVTQENSAQLVIQGLKETKDWSSFDPKKILGESAIFRMNRTDWINLSAILPEFRVALKALRVGDYTNLPIRGKDGFHIIALVNARPFELPSIEIIDAELKAIAERRILDQYIQSLTKSSLPN